MGKIQSSRKLISGFCDNSRDPSEFTDEEAALLGKLLQEHKLDESDITEAVGAVEATEFSATDDRTIPVNGTLQVRRGILPGALRVALLKPRRGQGTGRGNVKPGDYSGTFVRIRQIPVNTPVGFFLHSSLGFLKGAWVDPNDVKAIPYATFIATTTEGGANTDFVGGFIFR